MPALSFFDGHHIGYAGSGYVYSIPKWVLAIGRRSSSIPFSHEGRNIRVGYFLPDFMVNQHQRSGITLCLGNLLHFLACSSSVTNGFMLVHLGWGGKVVWGNLSQIEGERGLL